MRLERHEPCHAPASGACCDACVVIGGGAWRTSFFLGLVDYLQEHFGEEELSRWAFCGESAGTTFALSLCLGVPASELQCRWAEAQLEASQHPLGLAGRAAGVARKTLSKLLTYGDRSEAEVIARLHGRFSTTMCSFEGASLVALQASEFDSIEEVLDACIGSGNIPLFADCTRLRWPRVAGKPVLDAGFLRNARTPLLPAKVAIYCIACSDYGDLDDLGLTLDIEPARPVPLSEMFRTPTTEGLASMRREGYERSHAFFSSANGMHKLQLARGPATSRPYHRRASSPPRLAAHSTKCTATTTTSSSSSSSSPASFNANTPPTIVRRGPLGRWNMSNLPSLAPAAGLLFALGAVAYMRLAAVPIFFFEPRQVLLQLAFGIES